MTRVTEEDRPGVPDTLPTEVKATVQQKDKPTPYEIKDSIPPPSKEYKAFNFIPRGAVSLIPDSVKDPIHYFRLFLTVAHLGLIAEHTNMKARIEIDAYQARPDRKAGPRKWREVTGDEIDVWIGILIAMGTTSLPSTEAYWNSHTDIGKDPEITRAMGKDRWQQIKRYLKINSPLDLKDQASKTSSWPSKVDPVLIDIFKTSRRYLQPGRDIAIDEQLLGFKGRSKHTLNIPSKTAGYGFKCYCVCNGNYLLDLRWTSKSEGITDLIKHPGLPDTGSVVVQLMKSLPAGEYVCFLDNFFSSVKLYTALKESGFAACGTAKRGSGIPLTQITMKELANKKKDWGINSITTAEDDGVLCYTFQDNNTVLFMSTQHEAIQFDEYFYMDAKRRKGIPPDATVLHGDPPTENLAFPMPIHEYNKHMGGVDGNAQMQSYYSPDVKARIFWFSLWIFAIDTAIINCFIHYLLKNSNPNQRMTHLDFRRSIQISCMRNQAGVTTKHVHVEANPRPSQRIPLHAWKSLPKRTLCHSCKISKRQANPRKANPRRVLSDISGNEPRKRPSQAPQVRWGCIANACNGLAFCRNGPCWVEHHQRGGQRSGWQT